MKTKILKKSLAIVFIPFCITLFSSCSILHSYFPELETDIMDFTQKLDFKKPTQPIKENPVVLFIGNSMTYYNDLPSTFGDLSYSGGFEPDIYELTEGSYRLEFFADETDDVGSDFYYAMKNHTEYGWDYVILQEQSRVSMLLAEDTMYPAARTLNKLIREINAEPVFLMTWAYKNGDSFSILGKDYETSREQMQTQVASNYIKIANELDAMVAPAGIAFLRAVSQYPDIELWDEDLTHPSPAGTYLAACVLYAYLFDQSPLGLEYIADLNAETATALQQIAYETVLD